MSITALRTITAASEKPITLSEAKAQLRITHNAEDVHIDGLIAAATDWAQTYTGRILVDTQVGIRLDRFPESGDSPWLQSDPNGQWFRIRPNVGRKMEACKRDKAITLPGGFVTAVNNIDYIDADDAPQTLTGPTSAAPGTDYQEDLTDDEWPMIFPGVDGWPSVASASVNAVLIDYQVGWVDPGDIPDSIKQAIRFKLADLFNVRDSNDSKSMTKVAENLLDPYMVPSV